LIRTGLRLTGPGFSRLKGEVSSRPHEEGGEATAVFVGDLDVVSHDVEFVGRSDLTKRPQRWLRRNGVCAVESVDEVDGPVFVKVIEAKGS
jgi:hypothetical protein